MSYFEKHTIVIGFKLLRKKGCDGHGIGKRSKGITSPIIDEPKVKHEALGLTGTKEKTMSTKIMFMKERLVAELAYPSEERETMNEEGNTLLLHPSYRIS